MPSSATRRRVAAVRALATISRAAPCARAARAIEEPIRPTPISASRLNGGAVLGTASRRLCQKFLQRGDDEMIGLIGAHAHAQRVGEVISGRLPQDEAARHEK